MNESYLQVQKALAKTVSGETLQVHEASAVMHAFARGDTDSHLVAAILCCLAMRGESPEELTGFAQAMQELSVPVPNPFPEAVDTCGTGGDGGRTLNISTAAALLASACGTPVIKHGNRAVSSQCGSADVLEALGIPFYSTPTDVVNQLENTKFSFLFAPYFHPAMKNLAPIRKALKIRTIFNILGPLVNPARVRRQTVGIADPKFLPILPRVFQSLGHEYVLVYHHESGMDEALSFGLTRCVGFIKEQWFDYVMNPKEFGFAQGNLDSLAGGDASYNATLIFNLFDQPQKVSPTLRETVILNAGLALQASNLSKSLESCLKQAEEALIRGEARDLLDRLQTRSPEVDAR